MQLAPSLLARAHTSPAIITPKEHPYKINKLPLKNHEFENETPIHLQNKDLPGFPTVVILVGEPGSGKTTVLINLLTSETFWRGFFDKIYYLGPTIKADLSYSLLKIPDERRVTDQDEFIPKLQEWAEEQRQAVELDRGQAPKCLFIFEDITSYYHTAQSSPDFLKCFNTIRHHKSTVLVNIHKFKGLQRTARQSGRHFILFPVSMTEMYQIAEDYIPFELSKDDFILMCQEVWKPDKKQPKPYLYINKHCDISKRYRRCFTDIIDVNYFKGAAKKQKASAMNPYNQISGNKQLELQNTDTKGCNSQCPCCCRPKKQSLKRKRNKKEKGDAIAHQGQTPPTSQPEEKQHSAPPGNPSSSMGPSDPRIPEKGTGKIEWEKMNPKKRRELLGFAYLR